MSENESFEEKKVDVFNLGCGAFLFIFFGAIVLKILGFDVVTWKGIFLFPILGFLFLIILQTILLPYLAKMYKYYRNSKK